MSIDWNDPYYGEQYVIGKIIPPTDWQARATAAEAENAKLRDVPNHIWAEARDTEWDAGFNHAVKLFRAALETDNG